MTGPEFIDQKKILFSVIAECDMFASHLHVRVCDINVICSLCAHQLPFPRRGYLRESH